MKNVWYCVACKAGAEETVSRQLSQVAEVAVFVPKVKGKRQSKAGDGPDLVPFFPGYLFVRLSRNASLRVIRYTPGVRDVVIFGNKIPAVPEAVIECLRQGVDLDVEAASQCGRAWPGTNSSPGRAV